MAKKIPATKSEIMAAIAEAAGISKKQAVAAYEKLLAVAYEGAKGPKGIVLPGLGKLIKAKSKARMGRNPATGAAIKIPARTKVKFRVAKAAKDAVLAERHNGDLTSELPLTGAGRELAPVFFDFTERS